MPELGGIPSVWRSPTARCPGNALGEADGMPPPSPARHNTSCQSIPEACRGAGRRAPALIPLPASGSAQDINLLTATSGCQGYVVIAPRDAG
jgi:hypothetical protein